MKLKQILKIATDILMTAALLLLMAYSLVGEVLHEWLGIGMFVLFVLHHILNNRWARNLFKGKYTPYRVLQIVFVVLPLISMLGSMISGIILSRYALNFLPIRGGWSWARVVHLLSAYWGFVFISIHLGLHWSIMVGMAKRMFKSKSDVRTWIVRAVGLAIACYGIYAFIKREIGSYMFLETQFVFFGSEESLVLFLIDYISVMGLFVFIGHYITEWVKRIGRKQSQPTNN